VKTPNHKRNTRKLTVSAATAGAGALALAGALAAPASAQPLQAGDTGQASSPAFVKQIASGTKLHHEYRAGGTGAVTSGPLTNPDDLGYLRGHLFVGFQNTVGSMGEAGADGDTNSTIVEFTRSGEEVRQWDVTGKVDGLGTDPAAGTVIATVNEDGNSSLYTLAAGSGELTHYTYSVPLPHQGGTDAISVYQGKILVAASAPSVTGDVPAVYEVTLQPPAAAGAPGVAAVSGLYDIDATAIAANGPAAGTNVTLALTDPDSNEVVPAQSPRFAGDFMLNSQGDQQLIFYRPGANLQVLTLPTSVDDSAWATSWRGTFFATDSSADTVDAIRGVFTPGAMYTAVAPCNANNAPNICPGPGFPANYLGSIDLGTGAVSPVATAGATIEPKGLIFVPFG